MQRIKCPACKHKKSRSEFPDSVKPGLYKSTAKHPCLRCEAQAKDAEAAYNATVEKRLDDERWWSENEANIAKWQHEYSLEFTLEKLREIGRQRQAAQLRATPPWADPRAIAKFYEEADRLTRETGIPHHVDHIVPLQGPVAAYGPFRGLRLVFGFHCEANLRVIEGSENMSKGNRYWPDMPDFLATDKMLREAA
jgi:hypothetical protein